MLDDALLNLANELLTRLALLVLGVLLSLARCARGLVRLLQQRLELRARQARVLRVLVQRHELQLLLDLGERAGLGGGHGGGGGLRRQGREEGRERVGHRGGGGDDAAAGDGGGDGTERGKGRAGRAGPRRRDGEACLLSLLLLLLGLAGERLLRLLLRGHGGATLREGRLPAQRAGTHARGARVTRGEGARGRAKRRHVRREATLGHDLRDELGLHLRRERLDLRWKGREAWGQEARRQRGEGAALLLLHARREHGTRLRRHAGR